MRSSGSIARSSCWGDDSAGQLGTGKRGSTASAADATPVPLGGHIVQLSVGSSYGCALDNAGSVTCWGDNQFGQLGRSQPPGQRLLPMPLGQRAIQVAAGDSHACALLADHSVTCWGDNAFGQLGAGPGARRGEPSRVRLPQAVDQIALGASHSCALLRNGDVRCWGAGRFGQLGLGNPQNIGDDEFPDSQPPVSMGGKARWLRAYWQQTCAMRDDDNVVCWGDNTFQQLGYPARQPLGDDETPDTLGPAVLGAGIKDVALGQLHSCGLYVDGSVRCWGFGPNGQLGYGSASSPPPPPPPPGGVPSSFPTPAPPNASVMLPSSLPTVDLGAPTAAVFAGSQTSCAVSNVGNLVCWGANQMGQLGYPNRANVGDDETPARVGTVPLFGDSMVPWSFVNPNHLQVFLESSRLESDDRSRLASGGALTFDIRNRGSVALKDFHLKYAFSAAERQGTAVTLRDRTTTRAQATLSRQALSDEYVLDLDFSGTELRAGQQLSRAESVELALKKKWCYKSNTCGSGGCAEYWGSCARRPSLWRAEVSLNRVLLPEAEGLLVAALPANRAAPRLAVIRASAVAVRVAEISTPPVARASVATRGSVATRAPEVVQAPEVIQALRPPRARRAVQGVRLLKSASVMTETTARRMSATLTVATTLLSATERLVMTAARAPRSISVTTARAPALHKLRPQKSSVRQ
jgi:alpha-tubulin suppressor-like RCC1 family protein